MRSLLEHDPFTDGEDLSFHQRGNWPASWIHLPNSATRPFFAAYKLGFVLEESRTVRVHVSADERYELSLDGARVGCGPERGDAHGWSFETYDFPLGAGEHLFVARVWSLGESVPFAQMSVAHGFLLCPQNPELVPLLATGQAPWSGKVLGGLSLRSKLCAWGTGDKLRVDGDSFDWGFENGEGEEWSEVETRERGARAGSQPEAQSVHFLVPAMLPPMLDEKRVGFQAKCVTDAPAPTSEISWRSADNIEPERAQWQAFLAGDERLEIPPHTTRRVLIDLEDYYCAYPELIVTGGRGSVVRIHWVEGLFENLENWNKGHRDEWEGKFFTAMWEKKDGVGDEFLPDGGNNRTFSTLWWEAGRWLEWQIETGDEALTLESFALRETRYPLQMESKFACNDADVMSMIPLMVRALQMCSHETYMDCPYYEQLMYVGDTRLEVLLTYVLTSDSRLPKKALRLFDWSRLKTGLTQSRYPSRILQIIPPFSLWWVGMVHDFALWRDEPAFVRSLLPGVRGVCDYFASLIGEDGLMSAPDGWNYADWVGMTAFRRPDEPHWKDGVPPDGEHGVSGVLNWQLLYTLRLAAQLEEWHGEPELAALQTRRADALFAAVHRHFWNEKRGLYADDLAHTHWSEHAQCLAILSGYPSDSQRESLERGLFGSDDLARTTIYFSHYLLESCRVLGRMDKFFERLEDWKALVHDGLKTTIESPEPTRSDCHAWGAHPLFHFFASVAGIRPTAPGFRRFEFSPQLGTLKHIEGEMPHPQGTLSFRADENGGEVKAPEGVERDFEV